MPVITAEMVRQQLFGLLAEQGISLDEPVHETLLIRDGCFCGRRFALGGYQLVWFIEENQIKLFEPNGSLCRSCSATEFLAPSLRRAA